MPIGGNDAKLRTRSSKSPPFEVKMLVEFIDVESRICIHLFGVFESLIGGIDETFCRRQPCPGFYIARPCGSAAQPVRNYPAAARSTCVQHWFCLTALHQPYGAVAP